MMNYKGTFCNSSWRLHGFILAGLMVFTFFGGFYLLDKYENEGDDDKYVIPMFNMLRQTAAINTDQLSALVLPAVVGVVDNSNNFVSSGVVVSPKGYMVTTWHSISNLTDVKAQVRTKNGLVSYATEVIRIQPEHDLVLLKIVTDERFLYMSIPNPEDIWPDQVAAFGMGAAGNTILKTGVLQPLPVTLNVDKFQLSQLLLTDSVYTWEQSGGPLVDVRAQLVGVNLAVKNNQGGIDGYIIPSKFIYLHFKEWLPKVKKKINNAPLSNTNPVDNGVDILTNSTNVRSFPQVENIAFDPNSSSLNIFGQSHGNEFRIGSFSLESILGLALLALISGIASGMMTMGGGLIQVSGMMIIFGYGIILVRPVVYLTNLFVFAASAYRSKKVGLLKWKNVSRVIPWVVVGVIFGYVVGNQVAEQQLTFMIGVMALALVVKTLLEIYKSNVAVKVSATSDETNDELDHLLKENKKPEQQESFFEDQVDKKHIKNTADWLTWIKNQTIKSSFLGVPVGVACGMLGITGGVLAVPLQQHIYGAKLRQAIAHSSVLGFFASLTGVIVAFAHGMNTGLITWQTIVGISAIMIPGAYLGGLIGARLLHAVSVNILRWVYVIIMLSVASKMIL